MASEGYMGMNLPGGGPWKFDCDVECIGYERIGKWVRRERTGKFGMFVRSLVTHTVKFWDGDRLIEAIKDTPYEGKKT